MRACAYLVVATSARALAQSARKGGIEVVALDCFGDLDTRSAAHRAEAIPSADGSIDAERLVRRADALCPGPHAGLVYGSGFEHRPALLGRLARGRALHGNDPATVARLKRPLAFAEILDAAGIPHPLTQTRRPSRTRGWLVKRIGGAGGGHVRPLTRDEQWDERDHYYQSRLAGRTLSLLFLADGRRHRTVGLSEQWCDGSDRSRPFRYGGAVSDVPIGASLRARLDRAAARLVEHTGLRGLNSLDVLVRGEEYGVLEINPRPSATFELYDAKSPASLFALHVAACRGELPSRIPMAPHAAAHAIVYAPASAVMPPAWTWPEWCTDLPPCGSRIEAGEPLVTVHAAAATPAASRTLARRRQRAVMRRWLGLSPSAKGRRGRVPGETRATVPSIGAVE